jgi:hypothetical protein
MRHGVGPFGDLEHAFCSGLLDHIERTVEATEGGRNSGDRSVSKIARVGRFQLVELEREHSGSLDPGSAAALAIREVLLVARFIVVEA